MPSLSEIGDLSIITSCLVLPGFLVDTLLNWVVTDDVTVEDCSENDTAKVVLVDEVLMMKGQVVRSVDDKTLTEGEVGVRVDGTSLVVDQIFKHVGQAMLTDRTSLTEGKELDKSHGEIGVDSVAVPIPI